MNNFSDPHLRRQEDFGQVGNTVKVGKDTFVGCTVIGEPPHVNCPFYQKSQAKHEKIYRENLIKSGELGKREDIGMARLGFKFCDVKKEEVVKLKVTDDVDLRKVAFLRKVQPSDEKLREDKLSGEEGEKLAAARKEEAQTLAKKVLKQDKTNKKVKNSQNTKKNVKFTSTSTQFKTHVNEGRRRSGWQSSPGGGLMGGAPGTSSSNVSTLKLLCLC